VVSGWHFFAHGVEPGKIIRKTAQALQFVPTTLCDEEAISLVIGFVFAQEEFFLDLVAQFPGIHIQKYYI
jgi:hypothetical protein